LKTVKILLLLASVSSALAAPTVSRPYSEPPVATPANVPAASTPLPAIGPADRDRVLTVGDQVTLEIVEDKEPPVARRVTDTGDLDVPYIGRVHVAGKTCADVANEVRRMLEADYYYKVTVKLAVDQVNRAASMGKVYLSGLVHTPGAQEIYNGEKITLSAVILKAGGFAQFADSRKVKVVRKNRNGDSQTFIVDMKAVLDQGKMDQDFDIQDGDYVIVPQRLINW
jgi:protein involved in polysaccharide export with SLBB domain